MNRTELYDVHVSLGARMVEFAGYAMPLHYGGVVDEHIRVREAVGLFDVSHMGEIDIRGPGFLTFADTLLSNSVRKLEVGQAQYTLMCYEDGGIVDDLLAYRFEDRIMLVVNAANTEKDFRWVVQHQPDDVEVENRSSTVTQLALQGPLAEQVLARTTDVPLDALAFYRFTEGEVAGVHQVLRVRSNGMERLVLDLQMYVGADKSHDSVEIEGDPPLSMRIEGGVFGDTATIGALVNAIPKVIDSAPGLRTVLDLPVPYAFPGVRP